MTTQPSFHTMCLTPQDFARVKMCYTCSGLFTQSGSQVGALYPWSCSIKSGNVQNLASSSSPAPHEHFLELAFVPHEVQNLEPVAKTARQQELAEPKGEEPAHLHTVH